jgi:hypothetical protein
MAILLKGLEYLGYFPENLQQVPPSIRSFVGKQLGLLTDLTNQYPWESSTRERHLAQIHEVTGWQDSQLFCAEYHEGEETTGGLTEVGCRFAALRCLPNR